MPAIPNSGDSIPLETLRYINQLKSENEKLKEKLSNSTIHIQLGYPLCFQCTKYECPENINALYVKLFKDADKKLEELWAMLVSERSLTRQQTDILWGIKDIFNEAKELQKHDRDFSI